MSRGHEPGLRQDFHKPLALLILFLILAQGVLATSNSTHNSTTPPSATNTPVVNSTAGENSTATSAPLPSNQPKGLYAPLEMEDFTLTTTPLTHGPINLNQPVHWEQRITVSNPHEQRREGIVNLLLHLPDGFASLVQHISIGTPVIAETALFPLTLESGETRTLDVRYETAPVVGVTSCQPRTIADLLPPDASNLESSIDLQQPVGRSCSLLVTHPPLYEPFSIELPAGASQVYQDGRPLVGTTIKFS